MTQRKEDQRKLAGCCKAGLTLTSAGLKEGARAWATSSSRDRMSLMSHWVPASVRSLKVAPACSSVSSSSSISVSSSSSSVSSSSIGDHSTQFARRAGDEGLSWLHCQGLSTHRHSKTNRLCDRSTVTHLGARSTCGGWGRRFSASIRCLWGLRSTARQQQGFI